jgi:gamma-glutamyltranspeptidase/glutathione hydrolase
MDHLAEGGRTFSVDGSSRAPNRAVVELFSEKRSRRFGHAATTVPSTPAVLAYMLERYGTIPLAEALAPAIRLARDGYQVTELQRRLQRRELGSLKKGNAGSVFLRDGEKPFAAGATLQQPALAATLERLSRKGIKDFYSGGIARAIAGDMEASGGLLQMDDLARIPYPLERDPLACRFGNLAVFTMPPPGAGRTLVEMLNILKRFPAAERDLDSPRGALLLAEIIRRSQLDRRDRPYDPNFYPQVIERRLTSREYAALAADQIRGRIRSGGETTHLSVVDRSGNVVSLTQSIERVFGAKVMTPGLGFLYNNYMSDFDYEDMAHPYFLRPNAVPWASVLPTIIFRARRPWLAIGSPGSERIASTIVQVLLRLSRQSPFDAVAAPRLHCSYDGKVSLEASCMRDDIPDMLRRRGFIIDIREPMSFYLGCVQMVLCEKGELIGVADPRRDGSAAGPRS